MGWVQGAQAQVEPAWSTELSRRDRLPIPGAKRHHCDIASQVAIELRTMAPAVQFASAQPAAQVSAKANGFNESAVTLVSSRQYRAANLPWP